MTAKYQMRLDLWCDCCVHPDWADECTGWLEDACGCSAAVGPYVRRLFDAWGVREGYERAKVLATLDGRARPDGWGLEDLTVLGVWDQDDYHTCWDRAWAARHGVPKGRVATMERWDYGTGDGVWPTAPATYAAS